MRKTILAIAIAASTTAAAGAKYNDEYNQVLVAGDRGGLLITAIKPEADCQPTVGTARSIADTGDIKLADGKRLRFAVRVDTKEQWDVNARVWISSNIEYTTFNPSPEFISELRRGSTLRIRVETASGPYYEGFDLSGYSVAISKAKVACIPNSKYFEGDSRPASSHETYL